MDELDIEEEGAAPDMGEEVSLGEDDELEVTELEDGGAIVDLGGEPDADEAAHGDNLAEFLPEQVVNRIGLELRQAVLDDLTSRADWEDTYKKGLKNLGMTIEEKTEPWDGASAARHPLLAETVVKFQAQTIGEIFPAHGPVKTSILGISTMEKEKQAKRVQGHMNYMTTCVMEEYRPETEKMLFSLPIAGASFRKLYYDNNLGRPVSMFVPAEDIIVDYAAPDIYNNAERVTHRIRMTPNDLLKNQVGGLYRDVDISTPVPETDNDIVSTIQNMIGVKPNERDARHVLFEIHTNLVIDDDSEDGIALPYVVTIEKDSGVVLAIRRNWKEDDELKRKVQYFVQYDFIPGLGLYGYGLVHMIGGLSEAATSILRQLVDAGTLANVPGGFKTRGMRIKGDNKPIAPGEWRDVDVPSGVLKDHFVPLMYKEPSATLYQLLGAIVEAGQRFASMADLKVADMNQDAPVGTTLAIMERAMKVQTAIQARIHAGLKREFKMLAEIIRDYTEPKYPYEVDAEAEIKKSDYDDRIDVIPVSDPNAGTLSQRIMQYQAVLQLATMNPQIYDLKLLHRQIISVIGVADAEKIIPIPEEIPATDPVTENGNIMNMSPVSAHEYQDHEAHLRVHKILLMDPQIAETMQNSQTGPAIQSALDAHVREHLALMYRHQIEQELGVPMPPLGQPLPPDVEKRLSVLIADAAEQLLGKKQAMAMAERNAAIQEDPIIQQKNRELDIRQMEVQRKQFADQTKAQLEARKEENAKQLKLIELELEARAKEAEIAAYSDENEIRGIELGIDLGARLDELDVERDKIKAMKNKSKNNG